MQIPPLKPYNSMSTKTFASLALAMQQDKGELALKKAPPKECVIPIEYDTQYDEPDDGSLRGGLYEHVYKQIDAFYTVCKRVANRAIYPLFDRLSLEDLFAFLRPDMELSFDDEETY